MEQQEPKEGILSIPQEYSEWGAMGESTNQNESTFPEPVVISEEDVDEDNPFYKVWRQSQSEDTNALDQLFRCQPHPSDVPLCPYPFHLKHEQNASGPAMTPA